MRKLYVIMGFVSVLFLVGVTQVSAQYANTTVVSKHGGNYTDPVIAMNDSANWCGTPSETNRCLLKIKRGVYNIGSSTLQMKSYIDIEGSGENKTRIIGSTTYQWPLGTIVGAAYTELRSLTVQNTGTGTAITNGYGVPSDPSDPPVKISNVKISAPEGRGMRNLYSSVTMTNVKIVAYKGVENIEGGWLTMKNTKLSASQTGVSSFRTNVRMDNVKISVTAGPDGGTGISLAETDILTMNNVKIKVSGEGANAGILSGDSSITGSDTIIDVSGGTGNYGINAGYYHSFGAITLGNSTVSATGGDKSVGVYGTGFGSATITDSTISATEAAESIGVYNAFSHGASFFQIDRSVIVGTTYSVYSEYYEGRTTQIGNSWLVGPLGGAGIKVCSAVYDSNHTFYANTCP